MFTIFINCAREDVYTGKQLRPVLFKTIKIIPPPPTTSGLDTPLVRDIVTILKQMVRNSKPFEKDTDWVDKNRDLGFWQGGLLILQISKSKAAQDKVFDTKSYIHLSLSPFLPTQYSFSSDINYKLIDN